LLECDKIQSGSPMSSHARRFALVSLVVASCTAPPPEAAEIDDDWLPTSALEVKLVPPAVPDHGEYVEVAGGELDGHSIPALSFKRTEVTVAEYRACWQHGGCSEPDPDDWCNGARSDRDQHPINCVSRSQADEYCTWAGGRLPTKWEWEWAAQGREAGRPYPWGDAEATCVRAVMSAGCGTDATWPVASKPAGVSVDGLHDLAGNVFEWTSTVEQSSCGPNGVIKGGSTFVKNPRWLRVDHEMGVPLDGQGLGDGIRCVREL
jgi:formylglycine-generating enzyme required for sulfatase activity